MKFGAVVAVAVATMTTASIQFGSDRFDLNRSDPIRSVESKQNKQTDYDSGRVGWLSAG